MEVRAIIPDKILDGVSHYGRGKNLNESLIEALEEWIAMRKVRDRHGHTPVQKSPPKSRWAKVAENMAKQNYLNGIGDELLEDIRDFRDGFEISAPFDEKVNDEKINDKKVK